MQRNLIFWAQEDRTQYQGETIKKQGVYTTRVNISSRVANFDSDKHFEI